MHGDGDRGWLCRGDRRRLDCLHNPSRNHDLIEPNDDVDHHHDNPYDHHHGALDHDDHPASGGEDGRRIVASAKLEPPGRWVG